MLTHEFELWSAAWSWLKGLSWLTSIDSRWWSLCVYWLKTHESIHGRHTTPKRIFSGSFQVKSTFWDERVEQLSKNSYNAQPRKVHVPRSAKVRSIIVTCQVTFEVKKPRLSRFSGSKSMFAHALCNLSCLSQLELGCPYWFMSLSWALVATQGHEFADVYWLMSTHLIHDGACCTLVRGSDPRAAREKNQKRDTETEKGGLFYILKTRDYQKHYT